MLRGIKNALLHWVGAVLTLVIPTSGYFSINGKRIYAFTSALTAGAAATAPDGTSTAPAGSFAFTTNATGKRQLFVSDGTYWQGYGFLSMQAQLATIATSAGNTDVSFIAPCSGKLSNVRFNGIDALTQSDTNYVQFTLINVTNTNADMILATAANSSKTTGGAALAANTTRDLTKHGTAGNLVVNAGDRLRFRVAVTGTLNNTITGPVVQVTIQPTT